MAFVDVGRVGSLRTVVMIGVLGIIGEIVRIGSALRLHNVNIEIIIFILNLFGFIFKSS